MKLAVFSDIHGNVPALEAVLEAIAQWGAEQVIVNGDIVSRGPCSLACLRLLAERLPGARLVKGNHETFVLSCETEIADPDDPTFDMRRFAHWTHNQLGESVEELKRWPDHLEWRGGEEGAVHITHGSRLGNRDGIGPSTRDEELPAKLGEGGDLFIASHTHKPLVRRFNGTLVVNTGSVGSPFDGDGRAAYGQFVFSRGKWRAEIERVAFDRDQTERDFTDSGFLEAGGPLARLILTEFRQARGHMGPWMKRYQAAIVARQITVADAVDDYLSRL